MRGEQPQILRCAQDDNPSSGLATNWEVGVSQITSHRSTLPWAGQGRVVHDRTEWFLLLDYAAGDAIAGVAGGVGHEIVFFSVDDE